MNAFALPCKSLNRNLSWGFPLGNLLPKTRVLERCVLERKREPNANASVSGTLRFRTMAGAKLGEISDLHYPDLPFLAFLEFLAVFVARNFLAFLSIFPWFGIVKESLLFFDLPFLAFSQKSKERKIRVLHQHLYDEARNDYCPHRNYYWINSRKGGSSNFCPDLVVFLAFFEGKNAQKSKEIPCSKKKENHQKKQGKEEQGNNFLLELITFRPIPVICPARRAKPENYWKR